MNKELRWKLAEMILDKSRAISRLVRHRGFQEIQIDFAIDFEIHIYFQKLGFQRVYEGYEIEEVIPWQATFREEGPHLLFSFNPEEDRLYFAITAPTLPKNAIVMKTDKKTAEKILVLGLP